MSEDGEAAGAVVLNFSVTHLKCAGSGDSGCPCGWGYAHRAPEGNGNVPKKSRVVEEDRTVGIPDGQYMMVLMLVGVERSVPRRRDCGWARRAQGAASCARSAS